MPYPIDTLGNDCPQETTKSKWREYTEAVIWAVLVSLFIRTWVVQSFRIPTGSMENTLLVGDCLLANKFIYGVTIPWTSSTFFKIRDPQRGDIVIFKYPLDPSADYIKRIVGIPGDEITIRDKQVYVNGVLSNNPQAWHSDRRILPQEVSVRDNFGPVRVPADAYFMLGDNRDNSSDSRFWGFVQRTDIRGWAFVKYWSWDNDRWLPRLNRIGQRIY